MVLMGQGCGKEVALFDLDDRSIRKEFLPVVS